MFILSFFLSLIVFLLVLVIPFAIKPVFLISLFPNSFLLAGIPMFILIVFFDFLLIRSVFRIDKRKNDLRPTTINLRFFTGFIIILVLTVLFVLFDKFIALLISGRDITLLFTKSCLLYVFIHGNFILPIFFFLLLYLFSFMLTPSKFSTFFSNRLFPIGILILLLIFLFVYRWDLGSNIVESIINPRIKIKYFDKNIKHVPKSLKAVFHLRKGEYGISLAQKDNDRSKAIAVLDDLKNVMENKKFKDSFELWNTKLKTDIFLKNDNDVVNDYQRIFTILKEPTSELLEEFSKALLLFKVPAVNTVYSTLNKYEKLSEKSEYLRTLREFLKENIEENTHGLELYYNAKNENIIKKKEELFIKVINDTVSYKVKDDAYYDYIEFLIKEKRKKLAYSKLIDFIGTFKNTPYLKKIDTVKSQIKRTSMRSDYKKREMYCYSIEVDGKPYIVSNYSFYEFNPNNFNIKKLFEFNPDSDLIIEDVISVDKYIWIFYKGGRADIVNTLTREFNTVLMPQGLIYKLPVTVGSQYIYIGTKNGIFVYNFSGNKTKIIGKQNGLTSENIRYLRFSKNKLFIGTTDTLILYNLLTMKVEIQRGYKDPVTQHEFNNFVFVYPTKNFMYGLGDNGLVKFNRVKSQWDDPVFKGLLKLYDENDKYLVVLDKNNSKYKIMIFDKKSEKIYKVFEDFQIGPPYLSLKILGNSIYIANGERKVNKISLNNFNIEKFQGDLDTNAGDILHMGILDDYLTIIQPYCLTFVYLKVE
ncbi:sulfite exporter TauE/SafE family protein [bacterium]|nr:sulfite exporter TauE/SafE family protein [bacterium]